MCPKVNISKNHLLCMNYSILLTSSFPQSDFHHVVPIRKHKHKRVQILGL